ncbi:MAG TPA: PorV/PorQ family protein [Elusimicrobiota bacterium]|jgi:hypothetical protein|nr:PorV/PorQ family protein [Elusimicrobiota bacterium]
MHLARAIFVALVAAAVSSREAAAAPGSTAANFLEIGVAPRPVALGQAFTGVADDVNAITYNPAGLAGLQRQELALTHNQYLEGIYQEYLAYAFPTARFGTVGLSVNMLRVSPFAGYDANDQRIADVTAQDTAIGAAYAYGLGPLSLGIAGYSLNSRLDDSRAKGTSWDAGALWTPNKRLRVGAALRHLGPEIRFINDPFPLPRTFKLGASYVLPSLWEGSKLMLCADGSFPRERSPYASGGVEFEPVEFAAIRAGYQGSLDAGSGIAAGVGLKLIHRAFSYFSYAEYPEWFPNIEVDYAFVALGSLGSTHRIGVLIKFGQPRKGSDEETVRPDRYGTREENESYGVFGFR